jgi:hypothetical protein
MGESITANVEKRTMGSHLSAERVLRGERVAPPAAGHTEHRAAQTGVPVVGISGAEQIPYGSSVWATCREIPKQNRLR